MSKKITIQERKSQPEGLKIDAHVHITEDGNWFDSNIDASLERLLIELENSSISKAIILPINGTVSNEYVAEVCNKYPKKLMGFATVDPLQGEHSVIELEKAVNDLGLRGLKLHPRLQNFPPNDSRIIPIIEKAGELDIPIVFDTFPQGPGLIENVLPLNYDRLAKEAPNTKIILAHSGGSRVLDALMVAKANENIYLDISYSMHYYQGSSVIKDFIFAIKKLGADRVIYGSDYPELGIRDSFEVVEEMLIDLSDKEKEWVFGNTISTMLNLG